MRNADDGPPPSPARTSHTSHTSHISHISHTYSAPAKVNLFLHVVGRRHDGYHLIQSAMQLIDLADLLTITARDDGRIVRVNEVPGIPEDDDLVIRAARLLQRAARSDRGASIAVHKRIPVGGGLGGGSSDAATTLLALNHLWELRWTRARLMALGLQLGADLPFFIAGRNAFVEGIGEIVTPIESPQTCLAIIYPGVSVPTALIFADAELTRDTEALKISDFSRSGPGSGYGVLREAPRAACVVLRNDLEPVASAHFKPVKEALSWLDRESRGAIGPARMTGSGACVIRPFETEADAGRAVEALPAGWSGWSVKSLAVHPHRELAADEANGAASDAPDAADASH